MLEGRNAVIYGGGGSIGGAVARAFAREGATVHLAGRTQTTLDAAAEAIRAAGGQAETARLDALDERAVDEHADSVAAQHGSLDISMSLISQQDVQGTPLAEMAADDLMRPVDVTARRARHMIRQGSGVILPSAATATRGRTSAGCRSRSAPPRRCGPHAPRRSRTSATPPSSPPRTGAGRSRAPQG